MMEPSIYVRKSKPVTAVLYDGENYVDIIIAVNTSKNEDNVAYYNKKTKEITIMNTKGKFIATEGDHIVRCEDDTFHPYKADVFYSMFIHAHAEVME